MLGQTTTLSLVLSILAAAPALINAHGQVDWIGCNGQQYDAWDLDDHYKAAYKKQDLQYGEQPAEKFSRKTDRLDLGPTDIFGKSFATGGYQDPLDYDDISPVGVIPAKAGDEITIQWDHHWPQGHPGPIGEWMAKCPGDSCSKVDATTLDWFCIAQHNFDKDANDWPTEIMTRNGRQWKFFLPNDLPGGAYIVRHELTALHNNTGPVEGTSASPQHYPIAFEIMLESSGTNLPTQTGKFPGMYSYDDYEWHHDIYHDGYNKKLVEWEFPGIAVYPGGYTTGVVNGRSVNSGASVGSPAPAGANPQPAGEQAPSSSAAPAEPAPSSTAAASAESSAAAEPGYQNGVALPTESTPTESAPAESAPASASAVAAQKTCRVRTTQAQQKRKRAVQQARHQRRSRSGLGKKH